MNKIKDFDKKIYQIYYEYNEYCKFSKFTSKIVLFFLHFDTLVLFLDFSIIQTNMQNVDFPSKNFINTMLRFVALDRVFDANQSVYYYIAIILKMLILLNIATIILFFTGILKNLEGKKLKNFMFSTSFILYYVLSGFFINIFIEEIFFNYKYFENFRIFNIVLDSLLLICLVVVGFIQNLFQRGEYFSKEDFLNNTDRGNNLRLFFLKIGLIVSLKICVFTQIKILLIIIFCLISFAILYIFYISLKFRIMENTEIEYFNHICVNVLISTFIVIFLQIFYPEINIVIYLFALLTFFWLFVNQYSQQHQKICIDQTQIIQNKEDYFFNMINFSSSRDSIKKLFLKGQFIQHETTCDQTSCFCQKENYYNPKNFDIQALDKNSDTKLYSRVLIQDVFKRLINEPKNENDVFLYIYFIYFLYKKQGNQMLAIYYLNILSNKELNYMQKFEIFRIQKNIDKQVYELSAEKFDERNLDEFLFFEKQYKLIQQSIKKLLAKLIEFWEIQIKNNSEISVENFKNIFTILEQKKQCNKIWKSLQRYFTYNQKLEFLHRIYEKEFLYQQPSMDLEYCFSQQSIYAYYQKGIQDNIFGESYYKYFFDKHSCIIQISMSKDDIGHIKKVNDNTLEFFKYTRDEMIDKNINILIPKSMRKWHDNILLNIYRSGVVYYKNQQFEVIAVTKYNEPINVKLLVKTQLNSDLSISMTCLLHPIRKEEYSPYILVDSCGFILTFSKVLQQILNLDLLDIMKYNPHISTVNLKFLLLLEFTQFCIEKIETIKSKDQQIAMELDGTIQDDIRVRQFSNFTMDNKELQKFYGNLQKLDLKKFKLDNSLLSCDENKIKIDSFTRSYVNESNDASLSQISFFLNNKTKLQSFTEFLISLVQQNSQQNQKSSARNKRHITIQITAEHIEYKNKKKLILIELKKIFENKIVQNQFQRNLISYKFEPRINDFNLENKSISIESRDFDPKQQYIQKNQSYIKNNENMFTKKPQNLPQKNNIQIIRLKYILFFAFIFLMSFELCQNLQKEIRNIKEKDQKFNNQVKLQQAVKEMSIAYTQFLNLFIDEYKDRFKFLLYHFSGQITKMLSDSQNKSELIDTFSDRDFTSSLNLPEKKYQMSYLYLYESILVDSFLIVDDPRKIQINKELYKMYQQDFKKQIFDNKKMINGMSCGKFSDDNLNDISLRFKLNFVLLFCFILIFFILFFFFMLKFYNSQIIFLAAIEQTPQEYIEKIAENYMNLQSFLDERFFTNDLYQKIQDEKLQDNDQIKKNKKESTLFLESQQEEKSSQRKNSKIYISLKNKDQKKLNVETIRANKSYQQYLFKEKIKQALKLFIIIIFISLFFSIKFLTVKILIIDKAKKLQKIGLFLIDDYWKIVSLSMNAKDYFIDNTSFITMSDEYQQCFRKENLSDLENFYQNEFKIGKDLQDLYQKPVCELQEVLEMFDLQNYEQCLQALGVYAKLNFITIKRKDTTQLDFVLKNQDPNVYDYNLNTIPSADTNQNASGSFLQIIINKFWTFHQQQFELYRRLTIIISLVYILTLITAFGFIYFFIIQSTKKNYNLFKNIYIDFVPDQVLSYNKLIHVKLKKSKIIKQIIYKFTLLNLQQKMKKQVQFPQCNQDNEQTQRFENKEQIGFQSSQTENNQQINIETQYISELNLKTIFYNLGKVNWYQIDPIIHKNSISNLIIYDLVDDVYFENFQHQQQNQLKKMKECLDNNNYCIVNKHGTYCAKKLKIQKSIVTENKLEFLRLINKTRKFKQKDIFQNVTFKSKSQEINEQKIQIRPNYQNSLKILLEKIKISNENNKKKASQIIQKIQKKISSKKQSVDNKQEETTIKKYIKLIKKEHFEKKSQSIKQYRFQSILKNIRLNRQDSQQNCDACNQTLEKENYAKCSQCSTQVHFLCYQISNIKEAKGKNWLCDLCCDNQNNGIHKEPQCPFCPVKGGAFKKTQFIFNDQNMKKINKYYQGQNTHENQCDSISTRNSLSLDYIWVHLSCTFWLKRIYYKNGQLKKYTSLKQKGFSYKCQICQTKNGYAIQCSEKCGYRAHVECARRADLQFEIKNWTDNGFTFHCPTHETDHVWHYLEKIEKIHKNDIHNFFVNFQNLGLELSYQESLQFSFTNQSIDQEKNEQYQKIDLSEQDIVQFLDNTMKKLYQEIQLTYTYLYGNQENTQFSIIQINQDIFHKIKLVLQIKLDISQKNIDHKTLLLKNQIQFLLHNQRNVFVKINTTNQLDGVCKNCYKNQATNIIKNNAEKYKNFYCYQCSTNFVQNSQKFYNQKNILQKQLGYVLKAEVPQIMKSMFQTQFTETQHDSINDIFEKKNNTNLEIMMKMNRLESVKKTVSKAAHYHAFKGLMSFYQEKFFKVPKLEKITKLVQLIFYNNVKKQLFEQQYFTKSIWFEILLF